MRCFDCFAELPSGAKVFAVLKRMRELPEDCDPVEARQLDSLCFDQVFICADCSGWYGDHPIDVTKDVALPAAPPAAPPAPQEPKP